MVYCARELSTSRLTAAPTVDPRSTVLVPQNALEQHHCQADSSPAAQEGKEDHKSGPWTRRDDVNSPYDDHESSGSDTSPLAATADVPDFLCYFTRADSMGGSPKGLIVRIPLQCLHYRLISFELSNFKHCFNTKISSPSFQFIEYQEFKDRIILRSAFISFRLSNHPKRSVKLS